MGPMKFMGTVFGTAGTAVVAVERVVVNTDKLLQSGFHAIDITVKGGIEDLKADEIVAAAKRRVRMVKAQAEADEILKGIEKEGGDA